MKTKARLYSSFNFAYAPRACLLAESLRKHESDIEIIALLVDEVTSDDGKLALELLHKYFDRVVLAKDLGIPNFRQWIFKHNVVEACTAVKPRFLERLLEESSSPVIYMDPDTYSFSPYISGLLAQNPASILLTPHQLEPNEEDLAIRDNELGSTKFGVFNLGFACIRKTEAGVRFANWWRKSCELYCYEDVADGIFTDQKWCDLVPALFEDFGVIRDPGMNVASWNLSRRQVRFDGEGEPCVNGARLKFFHFTKVGSVGDKMIERYAKSNVEAFELLRLYTRKLSALQEKFPKVGWCYGEYGDGTPVQNAHRIMYRGRADLMREFSSPYNSRGSSYKAWLLESNSL